MISSDDDWFNLLSFLLYNCYSKYAKCKFDTMIYQYNVIVDFPTLGILKDCNLFNADWYKMCSFFQLKREQAGG